MLLWGSELRNGDGREEESDALRRDKRDKERAMESRGRWSADKSCQKVWPQRLELHSIQRPVAEDWEILSSSLGQQTSTQFEEVLRKHCISLSCVCFLCDAAISSLCCRSDYAIVSVHLMILEKHFGIMHNLIVYYVYDKMCLTLFALSLLRVLND